MLNPSNTFFISGQIFFTGIQGGVGGIKVPLQWKPGRYVDVDRTGYLNTLSINTLYSAGYFFNLSQVQPALGFQYDWEGTWVIQPGITFLRDPFRFQIQYSWIDGRFSAGGIGTLADKDNLAFRVDYLL